MIFTPITKPKKTQYDPSEDLVIINNYYSATSAQIAEYLGRTKYSVDNRIKDLIACGKLKHKQKATLKKQEARKREILKGE